MKIKAFLIFVLLPIFSYAQNNPEITSGEIINHIKFLASDELQGRQTGTESCNKAADYLAEEFESYGLQPVGENNSYFQTFDIVTELQLGENNTLSIQAGDQSMTPDLNEDFMPLAFSANEQVSGNLYFAGYGITLENVYDDYDKINVKDQIVLMFRYSPKWDSTDNKLRQMASIRFKAINAREHGGKAAIIVTGPENEDQGDLINLKYDHNFSDAGIPVISLSRNIAEKIFKANGLDMMEIQKKLNSDSVSISQSFTNTKIDLRTEVVKIMSPTKNVIGYLQGNHPILKDEIIIIGAHYDHLGLGGEGSLADKYGEPHNGADDNASGTSGVLELAEYFSSIRNRLSRSYIFIAFTGEEIGMLGSAHYVKNPVKPLENTITMINMDMIGRLQDNKLIIYGTGSSSEWKEMLDKENRKYNFELTFNAEGYGPSDHTPFYAKEIPVLFFFTGIHGDYHRPSDDWEKINTSGEHNILNYIRDILLDIDQKESKPAYAVAKAPSHSSMGGGQRGSVYIGTIPDFSGNVTGYKISGVNEGSPAAIAGLKGGDIITKFAGQNITNIYDFMYAMQSCKAGKAVEVEILRNEEKISLELIPAEPKEKK